MQMSCYDKWSPNAEDNADCIVEDVCATCAYWQHSWHTFQQREMVWGMDRRKRGRVGLMMMHARKSMKTCEMQRQSVAEFCHWWCNNPAFSSYCSKCKTMWRLQDVVSNQMTTHTAGWGRGQPTAYEWPIHCVTASWSHDSKSWKDEVSAGWDHEDMDWCHLLWSWEYNWVPSWPSTDIMIWRNYSHLTNQHNP